MDIRRITEIGVAVHDLERSAGLLVELFGAVAGDVIEIPRYDMHYRMCRLGKIDFEVMAPTSDRGVIATFLAARGEGLHHIAFAVDDIDDTMRTLQRKGVRFVDDTPLRQQLEVVDFAGRRFCDDIEFAFTQPRSILGILFEFIQYPDGYATP